MSELSTFFVASDASLGKVFYPKDFVVATLSSDQVALEAAEAVGDAGLPEGAPKAVSGREMLEFFKEFRTEAGVSGDALRALSRFMDTEAKFADADIETAKHGSAFLVMRCNTETDSHRLTSILAPFQPSAVHWYRSSGVESLV
jgi:hypothetical protein